MNTDSFFSIGKTHNVCQDYCRHGASYVVVSDGCSSSPDTDFGSRLLTVSAIEHFIRKGELDGHFISWRGKDYISLLPLNVRCLDATLIFAYADAEKIIVKAWGDGIIISKSKTGDIFFWEISYSGGAPAYLSYLLEKERLERYCKEFGGIRTVKMFKLGETNPISITETSVYEGFEFNLVLTDVEMVMLGTDGVQSFIDADFNPVSVMDVVKNLTDIRSYTGEFVKRNTKFFLTKDCKNKGWTHGDDLGVAAINMG